MVRIFVVIGNFKQEVISILENAIVDPISDPGASGKFLTYATPPVPLKIPLPVL
jgi:6,7-dimethyl-8-ribityllumazine synthase